MLTQKIKEATGLDVYAASVTEAGGATWFLARQGTAKVVGCVGGTIDGSVVANIDGKPVRVGTLTPGNAVALRKALPWTAPRCLGLQTSCGLGDRTGLATPGHVRSVRGTGFAPVLAQQSIREMTRTQRTPQEVIDAATWGVFQEGFKDGFGSDGDHIQNPEDLVPTVAAGFRMFTIDPGKHVVNEAGTLTGAALDERLKGLDLATLETTIADLTRLYADKDFTLVGGGKFRFDKQSLMQTLVKYGNAVAHVVRMYRKLGELAGKNFELEVSVDETESPTAAQEHYYFAAELKRLGVTWVSLAPRFIGRFEKGVDYIGDIGLFRESFAQHVAVMRTLGPYKISIHSGSDKFSIYPVIAELTGGLVHLKTAGTNYLCALQAVAGANPALFREILEFARSRYETDKASYHVSAQLAKIPPSTGMNDRQLVELLNDFDARQVLHVTFGSVLTLDGGKKFGDPIRQALTGNEELHYATVKDQIDKHLKPFLGVVKRGS